MGVSIDEALRRQQELSRELARLKGGAGYAGHRRQAGQRQAEQSRAGREIGELPAVAHPQRKRGCRRDFKRFCRSYLPETFFRPFCADHLTVIGRIQQAILEGGLFALAMPRGSGKTALVEAACLWSALYGHHKFVCIIGATLEHAAEMLESVRTSLETNPRLAEDFPEVCTPIGKLDRINQRRLLYRGKPVRVELTDRQLILPDLPDSPAGGVILRFAGITGRIRGMKYKRADGLDVRPSLVIIDDPQTDESARSPLQCQVRLNTICGAVLGLAGPGQEISAVMPCTVIQRGDLADSILDRERHPEWQGERMKLVYAWPADEKLWQRYRELRRESLRNGRRGEEATAVYRSKRALMDAGAELAWAQRKNPGELSALQHAQNLLCDRGEQAFYSEFQNEPMQVQSAAVLLSAGALALRLSKLGRGKVPKAAGHVTAYIDVHDRLLYWLVAAWGDNFAGGPIDYGTYPDQKQLYFDQTSAAICMADVHRGVTDDGWIAAGLGALTSYLLARSFPREDGATMKVGKLLIDAHWGQKTELVRTFCRRHPQSGTIVMPSMGQFVGASSKPYSEYRPEPGAQLGNHWRIPPARGGDRHVAPDVNWWKSFAAERLLLPIGTPGAWELFGDDPKVHQLFCDHCVAEEPVETAAKGRVVQEWKWKPGRPDNHWWDCLVGAAVAGSLLGVTIAGREPAASRRRPAAERPSLADLAKGKG